MKISIPKREIRMYTLLSTFPLHDGPANRRDAAAGKSFRTKFEGNTVSARDVTSSERVRIWRKPNDRKTGGEV